MDQTQQKVPLIETIPPEILGFLESLLTDAGMEHLDKKMHDSMIEELYVRLDKFLISQIVENLPEEKLEEFANLTEKNPTSQVIQEYLAANMPNAQDVFGKAFGEFREVYLTGAQKGQEILEQEQQNKPA